ncbi:hypothetical protein [Nostoc sp.]|uniref:hypothetical protein n=1 Tax=Nostoc sp. TaxID=1180 RepID=UPI003FA5AE81
MALINQRVDVPVIVDESKCLEKCTACIEVRSLSPVGWVERSGTQHMISEKQKIFIL